MRGLAACLLAALCFGGLSTMAACSDSSDGGSGGAGGTPAAGAGGKASSAGSTSKAGSGGGSECGFQSVDCSGCLQDSCGDEATACGDSGTCGLALQDLAMNCVCDPDKDPAQCITDFVTNNGKPAKDLADCFAAKCADSCH